MAMQIDLLLACKTLTDLDFMFTELNHIDGNTWRIQVDRHRAIRFDWIEELGAINIQLE
ncbi:hypothetical protein [Qipengyuania gaetbuli]|uniref:hypothetical protein n=1 Tax=Qipengyuania gaetbuli TaxID=266952 RepID=UPI001CD7C63A|nr:hypothetical protein [Qipengyuania gaetbuli]MCA0909040.1 hypothetical protein [Qipengyuania gaetbuli]